MLVFMFIVVWSLQRYIIPAFFIYFLPSFYAFNERTNKKDLKEQLGADYAKYQTEGMNAFIEGFNQKSKNLTASDMSGGKYQVKMKIISLDKFFSVMSIIPGNNHKVTAEISVLQDGKEICKMKSKDLEGDCDSEIFDSYTKAMNALGQKVAKGK